MDFDAQESGSRASLIYRVATLRFESDGIYREPMRLGEGEVPADLLARLGVERSEARYSEEVRPHPLQEAV